MRRPTKSRKSPADVSPAWVDGTLPDLASDLPSFSTEPLRLGDVVNESSLMVVREPLPGDPRRIPVATVSHAYTLIQHRDAVQPLLDGLGAAGLRLPDVRAWRWLSSRGERLVLRAALREASFDPGDGHPVQVCVECVNSVDRSSALEYRLYGWRVVCRNGMVMSIDRAVRVRHATGPSRLARAKADVMALLAGARAIPERMRGWYSTHVTDGALRSWVDQDISKHWTRALAARVFSILRTGWDGAAQAAAGTPPSCWTVQQQVEVPGSGAPVANAYHAAQAVAWVASREESSEQRQQREVDVEALVGLLLARVS